MRIAPTTSSSRRLVRPPADACLGRDDARPPIKSDASQRLTRYLCAPLGCWWLNGAVKYSTAVLGCDRSLTACREPAGRDESAITDAYLLDGLLNGPESLDVVSIALVVDLPVEEVKRAPCSLITHLVLGSAA